MPKDFVIVVHSLKTYTLNVPHFNFIKHKGHFYAAVLRRQFKSRLHQCNAVPITTRANVSNKIQPSSIESNESTEEFEQGRILFYSSTGSLGVLLFLCLAFSEDPKDCT